MKTISLSLLAAVTALFSLQSAHAQEAVPRMYAEIGYTQLKAKESIAGASLKFSPGAVTGVLGYEFIPNVAVEGLLGLGAGEGKIKVNGVKTGVKGQVNNALGLFVKPSIAVSDRINLFARVGWVRSELEMSVPGFSTSESDTDVAYGIGANFNVSKASYIQASWMNYYKKDGFKIDGFNVAYGFRF